MFYYTYIKYEWKGNNMVIRTLKAMLIKAALITLVLNDSIINATPNQQINNLDNKAAINTTPSSINELNKLIKGSSENLDKISSVLEFTAQAINKGSIVLQNRVAAKKWIKTNQKNIKTLEDSLNEFDIDIEKIYKVNFISKFLIAHIHNQLEHQLQNIQGFEIDLDAIKFKNTQLAKITSKLTNQLINSNLKKILELQDKANEIGLTSVNKVARKVEQLNDKYQITRILGITPPIALLGLAALYYAPLSWFKEGTLLYKLKNYGIGFSKYTSPKEYKDAEKKGMVYYI